MEEEFKLTSPAFENNGVIPPKYTSDGENTNPPLNISGVPEGTVALALIVDDPDAATDPDGPGHTFVHWVLFNISPDTAKIDENSIPAGANEGLNGAGSPGYIGPAPPNGEHRYFFKIYALNSAVSPDAKVSSEELLKDIKPLIIAETQLVGRYAKLERVES